MRDDKEHDYFEGRMKARFGDPEGADYEHEAERGGARRASKVLAAILGIFLAAAIVVAHAAPSVANAEECGLVADMVLVASALLKHDVAPEKRAAVMEDTYRTALGGGEAKKWRELLDIAVRFAKRDQVRGIEPQDLADAVNEGCQRGRGNLDPIFGTES